MIASQVDISRALSIQGWMSEKELTWLASKAQKCKVIIEVGSFKGRSARALADNLPEDGVLHCVDPWNGNYPGVLPPINTFVFPEFYANLRDHIISGKVIPHREFFDCFDFGRGRADMVFIDGDHSYDGVKADILHAFKMVRVGGYLCGHDYSPENWPGTVKAVNELVKVQRVEDTIWSTKR